MRLSDFPTLPDRAQQGSVNYMYVGRWMLKHDWGDVEVDQTRLFYDGNSQGGIMGGALTALAPDFERAVLGVPGMNYSTLLRRSVDFDMYAKGEIEGIDTAAGPLRQLPERAGAAADHEHPAARGAGPAQPPAQRREGPPAESGLPLRQWSRHRGLRRRPLLRQRVHRGALRALARRAPRVRRTHTG